MRIIIVEGGIAMKEKMIKFLKEKKNYLIALIPIVMIVGLLLLKLSIVTRNQTIILEEDDEAEELTLKEDTSVEETSYDEYYYVDIKGAILNPGVYQVKKGSRVKDIIELAGGLLENSDTSLINLAKTVTDEMVIIIYTKSEVSSNSTNDNTLANDAIYSSNQQSTSDSTTSNIVNINTASLEELMTLSGIGESKASAIISYREENGSFQTTQEITNVSGIGQAIYEKIKNFITV